MRQRGRGPETAGGIRMGDAGIVWDAFLCGVDKWTDHWGDPLLSGSIFMLSYGVAALMIFRAAREVTSRERGYWRLCGVLFVFQAVNTHLDLHALPGTFGRCLAHAQGWYQDRLEVQIAFLAAVAAIMALILLIVLITFFRDIFSYFLLTLGVATALGFTVVKGISYHGFEQYYGGHLGPFRTADFIEYSGIVLAFLAALIRLRKIRLYET